MGPLTPFRTLSLLNLDITVTGTTRRTTMADGGTAEMEMDVDAAFIDALPITPLIIYSDRNLPS